MTVRDFKSALLSVMKDRIEEQRGVSIAVGIAIAAAFDGKAVKESEKAIERMVRELETAQEELFLGKKSAVNRQNEKRAEDGGLDRKSVGVWQNLSKIDAAFTKLTGKMTGAPWSQMNTGTRDMSMGALEGRAGKITGQEIMGKVAAGAAREGRARPGRRT